MPLIIFAKKTVSCYLAYKLKMAVLINFSAFNELNVNLINAIEDY